MFRKPVAIINPDSGRRRGALWIKKNEGTLRKIFPSIELHYTAIETSTSQSSRKIAEKGCDLLMVVGGDGTLSEVVDGLMTGSKDLALPHLVLCPTGRGSDFARGLKSRGFPQALELEQIQEGSFSSLDVGRITYLKSGSVRHFINVADAGLGGSVVATIARSRSRIGGSLTYFLAALRGWWTEPGWRMNLKSSLESFDGTFLATVIANGGYFGGGMNIAPTSQPNDGLLDVICVPPFGISRLLEVSLALYRGTLSGLRGARSLSVAEFELHSPGLVPLELDGEEGGSVPVRVGVLPKALNLALCR